MTQYFQPNTPKHLALAKRNLGFVGLRLYLVGLLLVNNGNTKHFLIKLRHALKLIKACTVHLRTKHCNMIRSRVLARPERIKLVRHKIGDARMIRWLRVNHGLPPTMTSPLPPKTKAQAKKPWPDWYKLYEAEQRAKLMEPCGWCWFGLEELTDGKKLFVRTSHHTSILQQPDPKPANQKTHTIVRFHPNELVLPDLPLPEIQTPKKDNNILSPSGTHSSSSDKNSPRQHPSPTSRSTHKPP